MQRVLMTVQGEKRLREELTHLKHSRRAEIVAAISEARAHGDLKENAEYHAAREQQGLNEARIRDIEMKLSCLQVIDITKIPVTGKVIFGATVDLLDINADAECTYCIVGEDEADVAAGKISVSSPVAKALLGRSVGDIAVVNAPGGEVEYEVCSIRHE